MFDSEDLRDIMDNTIASIPSSLETKSGIDQLKSDILQIKGALLGRLGSNMQEVFAEEIVKHLGGGQTKALSAVLLLDTVLRRFQDREIRELSTLNNELVGQQETIFSTFRTQCENLKNPKHAPSFKEHFLLEGLLSSVDLLGSLFTNRTGQLSSAFPKLAQRLRTEQSLLFYHVQEGSSVSFDLFSGEEKLDFFGSACFPSAEVIGLKPFAVETARARERLIDSSNRGQIVGMKEYIDCAEKLSSFVKLKFEYFSGLESRDLKRELRFAKWIAEKSTTVDPTQIVNEYQRVYFSLSESDWQDSPLDKSDLLTSVDIPEAEDGKIRLRSAECESPRALSMTNRVDSDSKIGSIFSRPARRSSSINITVNERPNAFSSIFASKVDRAPGFPTSLPPSRLGRASRPPAAIESPFDGPSSGFESLNDGSFAKMQSLNEVSHSKFSFAQKIGAVVAKSRTNKPTPFDTIGFDTFSLHPETENKEKSKAEEELEMEEKKEEIIEKRNDIGTKKESTLKIKSDKEIDNGPTQRPRLGSGFGIGMGTRLGFGQTPELSIGSGFGFGMGTGLFGSGLKRKEVERVGSGSKNPFAQLFNVAGDGSVRSQRSSMNGGHGSFNQNLRKVSVLPARVATLQPCLPSPATIVGPSAPRPLGVSPPQGLLRHPSQSSIKEGAKSTELCLCPPTTFFSRDSAEDPALVAALRRIDELTRDISRKKTQRRVSATIQLFSQSIRHLPLRLANIGSLMNRPSRPQPIILPPILTLRKLPTTLLQPVKPKRRNHEGPWQTLHWPNTPHVSPSLTMSFPLSLALQSGHVTVNTRLCSTYSFLIQPKVQVHLQVQKEVEEQVSVAMAEGEAIVKMSSVRQGLERLMQKVGETREAVEFAAAHWATLSANWRTELVSVTSIARAAADARIELAAVRRSAAAAETEKQRNTETNRRGMLIDVRTSVIELRKKATAMQMQFLNALAVAKHVAGRVESTRPGVRARLMLAEAQDATLRALREELRDAKEARAKADEDFVQNNTRLATLALENRALRKENREVLSAHPPNQSETRITALTALNKKLTEQNVDLKIQVESLQAAAPIDALRAAVFRLEKENVELSQANRRVLARSTAPKPVRTTPAVALPIPATRAGSAFLDRLHQSLDLLSKIPSSSPVREQELSSYCKASFSSSYRLSICEGLVAEVSEQLTSNDSQPTVDFRLRLLNTSSSTLKIAGIFTPESSSFFRKYVQGDPYEVKVIPGNSESTAEFRLSFNCLPQSEFEPPSLQLSISSSRSPTEQVTLVLPLGLLKLLPQTSAPPAVFRAVSSMKRLRQETIVMPRAIEASVLSSIFPYIVPLDALGREFGVKISCVADYYLLFNIGPRTLSFSVHSLEMNPLMNSLVTFLTILLPQVL